MWCLLIFTSKLPPTHFVNIISFYKQLDMPKEYILENIHAVVKDVASHKPAEFSK